MAEPKIVKVQHPSLDGSWVEFYEPSLRQLDVLDAYEKLVRQEADSFRLAEEGAMERESILFDDSKKRLVK